MFWKKIIEASKITKDDFVLEIGPGIGTMTQYLAEAAREVVAVEIDKTLIPILENDTLKDWDNVTVINEDILKTILRRWHRRKKWGQAYQGGCQSALLYYHAYHYGTF